MKNMKGIWNRLWREEEAQDLTEYALIIVLIGLASTAAINGLATAIANVFSNAATSLS